MYENLIKYVDKEKRILIKKKIHGKHNLENFYVDGKMN